MSLTQDDRRSLADRVARRVAGHGIPRRVIEGAVEHAAPALAQGTPARASNAPAAPSPAPAGAGAFVAAFTATSAPDLATRVRRALAARGVVPDALAAATAGRHNVVTVSLSADRAVVEQAAEAAGARVSVVPAGDAR